MSDLREKVLALAVEICGSDPRTVAGHKQRALALAVAALVAEDCEQQLRNETFTYQSNGSTQSAVRAVVDQAVGHIRRIKKTLGADA